MSRSVSERSRQARLSLEGLEALDRLTRQLPRGPNDDEIINDERMRLMRIIADEEYPRNDNDPYVYAS